MIEESRARALASDPQWLALLHYAPQYVSPADPTRIKDDAFFLSAQGMHTPEAELEATLSAFLNDPVLSDAHPICRFPARWRWLSSQIPQLSAAPRVNCGRFEAWRTALNAQGITLVFPASFLNNPASAFGHTFIRIDQSREGQSSDLLAYAADFAAKTQGEDALRYAFKGIFGGFDGFYTVGPFHKKVDKYSDLEHRDIWEYRLNFTQSEIDLLVAHLWETRDLPFTYYYFDENCSYHILALLDVARPQLGLIRSSRTWVMPVDTVRAIVERPNLVDSFRFRPSAATTLRARLKAHDAAIGRVGKQIASGDAVGPLLSALDQEQRASALDIAYEYNTYHRVRNRGEDSKERETAFEILKQRSQLPVRPALRVETPAVRPDQGHSTALTSIGFGRVQDKNVSELQFRPALHALSDRPEGYLLGNQIKFMDTTLQWGEEEGVRLHRITAVDIAALTPRDEFFSPVSWRVNVNGARFRARDGDQPFAYSLNGGAGHTYALGESMIVYGMVESDLTVARDFSDNFFLSLGASAGLVYHLGQGFGLEAKAQVLPSLWGETITQRTLSVSPRISLGRNDAIRFDGSVHEAYGRSTWSSIVRFEHFFSPW